MRNADMPAMPTDALYVPDYDDSSNDKLVPRNGLTKREYLAAMALPRIEVMSKDGKASDEEVAKKAARIAVETADALLAELEKTQ